ncbi:MAG: recombinase family protein [Lachnospiraceae bacterium]|nr:recombinase family protein [Lachnospiraceae bacterium]
MRIRKVAIYARVSTEHEAQLSALENQVQYYDDLIGRHPDWVLYRRYIDEGITGTSIAKRKNFMRMMEDAKDGHFDLIVTREVSRFARNTVDTLQQTRLLKRMGIEVYFTEDGIWTMNDEDGELRLTIMATLAQNESKKTSMRVKAGQMVSFQNGVIYGTGNVLGYDKVGPEYVINEAQAKTVRKIFDMYLAGNGCQKIKRRLEQDGDLTAMGKSLWHFSTIGHILKNRLYCGELEYRKEYVPDYLEQKRTKNRGELDRVIVEGRHQPIVTKEEFERVQKLIEEKSPQMEKCRTNRGVYSDDLWRKKMRCQCGHAFAKTKWHSKKNFTTYTYKCYDQTRTGTVSARLKNSLSIEGVCPVPLVQDWKMHTMAQKVLHAIFDDTEATLREAAAVLGGGLAGVEQAEALRDKSIVEERLKKEQGRYETLLDMRMNNEIPKEVFSRKQQEVEQKIRELEQQMMQYRDVKPATEADVSGKLEALRRLMAQFTMPEDGEFTESDIDKYVTGVRVYEDHFEWLLNLDTNTRGELDDAGSPVYFKKITVTPDDERAWFKTHSQWSKSNKYAELEARIYI